MYNTESSIQCFFPAYIHNSHLEWQLKHPSFYISGIYCTTWASRCTSIFSLDVILLLQRILISYPKLNNNSTWSCMGSGSFLVSTFLHVSQNLINCLVFDFLWEPVTISEIMSRGYPGIGSKSINYTEVSEDLVSHSSKKKYIMYNWLTFCTAETPI